MRDGGRRGRCEAVSYTHQMCIRDRKGAVLVIESTISPNTVDRFVRPLLIEAEREDVKLVHAPERIIPCLLYTST